MYDTTIIRYGEIFLKSEYVRRRFEDMLSANIELKLKNLGFEYGLRRKRHRIYIDSKEPETAALEIAKVFGVGPTSPAIKADAEMPEIIKYGVRLSK